MRNWAWSVYIDGSKQQEDLTNSISQNEPQIIANLNKCIDNIERKKIQYVEKHFNQIKSEESLFDKRSKNHRKHLRIIKQKYSSKKKHSLFGKLKL
jgi:hypothetical protein